MKPHRFTPALATVPLLLLSGCSGPQSMLAPVSPVAETIERLWWVLLAVCTIVLVVVLAALAVAVFRRHADLGPAPSERRGTLAVLTAGAFVPVIILVGMFLYAMDTTRAIAPPGEGEERLTILVTGKQYWWDVRYSAPGSDEVVVTANEIHIPVGQDVRLLLESADVIHSVWVPPLNGKTDMIPGRTNTMWLRADRPGIYPGQCAEYCGAQHTWMRLLVIAQPEEEFYGWLSRIQRHSAGIPPAPDPAAGARDHAGPPIQDSVREAGLARNARIRRGREVFVDKRCDACHTIRGEFENSDGTGPDLTHLASRRTLAAGLLPNTRGHLAGWLGNPQVLKPGNLMPRTPLEPDELHALLDYLMTLR